MEAVLPCIPAHDRDLRNYNGTDYYVDLVVATAGNTFAQCVRLLDDRLPIETRALVNCAFREKYSVPFADVWKRQSRFIGLR